MADNKESVDGTLANSIAMLEQILEVMPQDTDALRALYNAYCKCGQMDRAFEYLNMLVDIVMSGGHAESAAFVQEQLSRFEEQFPSEVASQLERLSTMIAPATGQEKSVAEAHRPEASKVDADIGEELSLAWRLYEENQLSQEEYASVLHDLTEVSSKELDVPVSVLHVLSDRGFPQMNRIMNYVSNRSGVPCLSLSNFELSERVASILPLAVSVHDGALPFAFFGDDLLVGVLNPFNNTLLEQIETQSGHRCHTYLIAPEEYDEALKKLRTLAEAA